MTVNQTSPPPSRRDDGANDDSHKDEDKVAKTAAAAADNLADVSRDEGNGREAEEEGEVRDGGGADRGADSGAKNPEKRGDQESVDEKKESGGGGGSGGKGDSRSAEKGRASATRLLDREKTCPFLLRVFCSTSRHNPMQDYAKGQSDN